MIDAQMVGTFVVGIATGIVIRAKIWWGSKSKDQKARAIADGIEVISDGRVTSSEITEYIKNHL